MRLNKYLASGTSLSRRSADEVIAAGRVTVNGRAAQQGMDIIDSDIVTLDNKRITYRPDKQTILLHKPRGYVVSHNGQGSKTIYDILPASYQSLNPIGRLDKESSGLLLLTNDGQLAHELTHPSRQKHKVYEVKLDRPLQPLHQQMINDNGLQLDDGPSKLQLERRRDSDDMRWIVTMHEGRNRQIRRTFTAVGYTVIELHRTQFGPYNLAPTLKAGQYRVLT
jgi:23S rRNA pseudouridine2605 synthase